MFRFAIYVFVEYFAQLKELNKIISQFTVGLLYLGFKTFTVVIQVKTASMNNILILSSQIYGRVL